MRASHTLRIVTLNLAFGVLLTGSAGAGVDEWTSNGPFGGWIYHLVIDPSSTDTLYAGTQYGGVYKSTDGGDHWSATNTGLDTKAWIIGLAIDPLSPTTLFADTRFDGMFKTTDGGDHWLPLENTEVRWPVVFDPQTPGTVYAASTGVLRSTDGGATWTAADNGLPEHPGVEVLAIDPQTPTTLYAGTEQQGVYKSTDAGGSWFAANNGLTSVAIWALAIDPQTPTTLYASGCCEGMLFKSVDGGANWFSADNGFSLVRVLSLAIDPQTPSTLYAGSDDSFEGPVGTVYKSTDAGGTWTQVHSGPAMRALVIDPSNPSTIYAATLPAGVLRSTDSGEHWNDLNQGLVNTEVTSLAIDAHAPHTLYAGTYGDEVHRSTDAGVTWTATENGLFHLEAVTTLAIDLQTPNILYAGTRFIGGHLLKSIDGGVNWFDSGDGIPDAGILSLAIDPQTPTTLHAGTEGFGMFQSTDAGAHWVSFDNELERESVMALAIDPRATTTLFAGTRKGVYKSTDGGVTWSAFNNGIPDQPFPTRIEALLLDPRNPDIVYAGGSRGVFRSIDGGADWTYQGLGPVLAMAIDPQIPTILYAGVSDGVWRSTDSGATWSDLDNGLDDRLVFALAVDPEQPSTVYAGTFRGGVKDIQLLDDQPILGLHRGRFRVEVDWHDFEGETGTGKVAAVLSEPTDSALLQSRDSAVARFFSPDNWEQLVKVLDGRVLNGHFWIFVASATNVEVTTTVTDTSCDQVKTYTHPLGQAAPAVTDVTAFGGCENPLPPSCADGDDIFCLGEDGRFQVETTWKDFSGGSGSGSEVSIPGPGLAKSNDSGLFYFFSRDNWELLVKVLDGCGINDRYWVFTAATTNVEYTVTVTDTGTGQVRAYTNPLGQAAQAVTDAGAFATCP